MQFKYPAILYFLGLVIIPILIHLFQLRKFQKIDFTNVKFLKKINIQTRKSSVLKRWLVLLSRICFILFLVLAFAQPFFKNQNALKEKETVIYIDNSFSMQAKRNGNSLLNTAVNELISNYPEDQKLSIFTNNKVFLNTSLKSIRNELLDLKFSTNQLKYNEVLLKGEQLFSKNNNGLKNFILVSDFQKNSEKITFKKDSSYVYIHNQILPDNKRNVSVDSVFVKSLNVNIAEFGVKLVNYGSDNRSVDIALYNNNKLASKQTVDIEDSSNVSFSLPTNNTINAYFKINDGALNYDNTYYFNLDYNKKCSVLEITENGDNDFLKRIYTEDEFKLTSVNISKLNYSVFQDYNLIVLNEVQSVSSSLLVALKSFKDKGGFVLIIPSIDVGLNSLNQYFKGEFYVDENEISEVSKKVTSINFDHPLFEDVFYKKVDNFQYPSVNKSFVLKPTLNAILNFEDGTPFLLKQNNTYVFSGAINQENSNFLESPIVVPVFYKIGKQSLKLPKLQYALNSSNNIDVKVDLEKDEILSIQNKDITVIPLQQTYSNYATINTSEIDLASGNYNLMQKDKLISNLSFNYDRSESSLSYYNFSDNNDISFSNNLKQVISDLKSLDDNNGLSKWFVIFALLFLIIELLLLKFLK